MNDLSVILRDITITRDARWLYAYLYSLTNLSYDRAYAVMEVLKHYGIPDDQMQVVGLGDKAPWHTSDLDPKGFQIEEKAEQNRCVVVLDTLDKEYGSIINAYAK